MLVFYINSENEGSPEWIVTSRSRIIVRTADLGPYGLVNQDACELYSLQVVIETIGKGADHDVCCCCSWPCL